MPNSPYQKQRLLYLLRIFMRKTDEGRGLTTNQILDELENVGISAERKSLYRDFKAMRDFGLDIEQTSSRQWYLANRPFSIEELIVLTDSINSTPFLTRDITGEILSRLKEFASEAQEERLDGRIKISDYVKMKNEGVFKNIDVINDAFRAKRKIEFKYFDYDARLKRVFRRDGKVYVVSPLELVYADENYYLLTFNDLHESMTPYRVDRMVDIAISEETSTKNRKAATWKLEDDIVLSFGVFSEKIRPVTLELKEHIANVVVDKFGTEIDMRPSREGWAKAYVKAPMTPQFFGWLFQLGSNIRIISPKSVIKKYLGYLDDIRNIYKLNE